MKRGPRDDYLTRWEDKIIFFFGILEYSRNKGNVLIDLEAKKAAGILLQIDQSENFLASLEK